MTDKLIAMVDVKVTAARAAELAWLAGATFKIPRHDLERFYHDITDAVHVDPVAVSHSRHIERREQKEKADFLTCLQSMRMFTDERPLSSRLPVSYQRVPPFVRSIIARIIGGRKRRDMPIWSRFPGFPLDLSVDILSDIFGFSYTRLRPTPVLLTHDIDSPEGLKRLAMFTAEEEAVGARSTNFIVPCGWPLDHGILSRLTSSGHEVGIHGFDHSNTTAFLDEPAIAERMAMMEELKSRYRISGYRAPSLLRTRTLLRALSRSFSYDTSIPTAGGLFPIPNNGCATARHFMVEGIHEIPLSMPRDGTLLFLGYKPDEIRDIWLTSADVISRSGGVIVLLTHCEQRFSGNEGMLTVYRDLLRHFKRDNRFSFMTCAEFIGSIDNEQR